jgi:hypothetical protein
VAGAAEASEKQSSSLSGARDGVFLANIVVFREIRGKIGARMDFSVYCFANSAFCRDI